MSILNWRDLIKGDKGDPGPIGQQGAPGIPMDRPCVMYGMCSVCKDTTVEVVRIGRFLWMCSKCELDFAKKLEELIKFK